MKINVVKQTAEEEYLFLDIIDVKDDIDQRCLSNVNPNLIFSASTANEIREKKEKIMIVR